MNFFEDVFLWFYEGSIVLMHLLTKSTIELVLIKLLSFFTYIGITMSRSQTCTFVLSLVLLHIQEHFPFDKRFSVSMAISIGTVRKKLGSSVTVLCMRGNSLYPLLSSLIGVWCRNKMETLEVSDNILDSLFIVCEVSLRGIVR